MLTSDKVYDAFHNKYFHGPTWLNITAQQMAASDIPKPTFKAETFYNVYDSDSLFEDDMIYEWITPLEMVDLFALHSRNISYLLSEDERSRKPIGNLKPGILRDTAHQYKFVQVGRSCVEWTLKKDDDIKILYGNKQVKEIIGMRSADLGIYIKEKRKCKGYNVSRKTVRVDMHDNVLEVLGV